jgi:hypothetical protein
MIGHDEVTRTVTPYLDQHPDERGRLAPLSDSLAAAGDIAARTRATLSHSRRTSP